MVEMKVIARVRSDFPSKFGIPRQSGLVPELQQRIVMEPDISVAERFEVWRNILISGSFGSFLRRQERTGLLRYVRPDSEAIRGWVSLPAGLRFDRIPSVSPV